MVTQLRVLIVEDSEDDTLLLIRELKRGNYEPIYRRVDTPEAMNAALDEKSWDIIISDYVMPRFSGLDALKLMQDRGLDLPFIIVSGKIGEDIAVEAMKAGAHDYVMKGNLTRLTQTVKRELGEAEVRRERRQAEEALRASEANYRAIFDAANDVILVYDIETDKIIDTNRKMMEVFGYTPEEARSLSIEDISSGELPRSKEDALQWINEAAGGEPRVLEWKAKSKAGYNFWVEISFRLANIGGKDRLLAIARDITERKLTEAKEKALEENKKEFYRRTIQAATEGKLVILDRDEIDRLEGYPIASYNIKRREDLGNIRHKIAEEAQKAGMEESRISDLVICTGEAITNVMKHAHGGMATLYKTPDSLLLVVSDHGPGIAAVNLPELALKKGYTTSESLGMGYKAMISLADRVYLATGPGGTTVGIEIKLHPPMPRQVILDSLPDAWEN
jgi:PAS domain S-box-containing protein